MSRIEGNKILGRLIIELACYLATVELFLICLSISCKDSFFSFERPERMGSSSGAFTTGTFERSSMSELLESIFSYSPVISRDYSPDTNLDYSPV